MSLGDGDGWKTERQTRAGWVGCGGGDGKRWRREERRGEGRGDTMWGKNKTGSEMMMTKEKKGDDNNRAVYINKNRK